MIFFRFLFVAIMLIALLFLRPEEGTAGVRSTEAAASTTAVDRGRYLTVIGGCNDCHTPMFGERAGNVPEEEWLVGAAMGFKGPWGTTYPTNLRLMVQRMSEQQWVDYVTTYEALPPMPWWALHAMDHADLRAVYAFIHSLGAAGEEAPAPLPPGTEPTTPYIPFMPVFPGGGGQ